MSVFRWASSFLLGRSWWMVAGVGLIGLLGGVWLGHSLEQRATLGVQLDLAEYKTSVAEARAKASEAALERYDGLQRSLQLIQETVQQASQKDQAFSDNLIKELQRDNGKSCPLSPAVERYITSLLNREQPGH